MESMNPAERTNPIETHPIKLELKRNGIASDKLIGNVLLVYLNLIEVHHWFDVETVVSPEGQSVFIKGKRNKQTEFEEYVLPISSKQELTTKRMAHYLKVASQSGSKGNSLTLAIVDTSSTILLYEISNGLVEPKLPSNKEIEKMQRIPYWSEQQGKWKI